MKVKFLFLSAVIIAMTLNVSAEENISNVSAGIQEYYAVEKNLSNINTNIGALKTDIEKIEQEISTLNNKVDGLNAEIESKSAEIIDTETNIENTKNDIINLDNKKGEFAVNKGTGYRIASILPAFIVGLWLSIVILTFLWKGE